MRSKGSLLGKQKSTAEKKLEAVSKLRAWVDEKVASETLDHYVRRGKLNRSEIALECGFARSSFSSNDLLADELQSIEFGLVQQGLLSEVAGASETSPSSSPALENRLANAEREIKNLRERLATKTAECEALKQKVQSANSLLDDIIPSGKRVRL